MCKSCDIDLNAGATIEEETGVMNVNDDTTIVAAHFRLGLQFRGLAVSLGPSQVTYNSFVSHSARKTKGIHRANYQIRVMKFPIGPFPSVLILFLFLRFLPSF